MAYVPTTFVDRSVEFPNRRTLTAVPGQADTFDVARAEGTVFEEGTKPDAANLNAEFGNVKTELDTINTNLTANSNPFIFAYDSASASYGYKAGGADTFHPFGRKMPIMFFDIHYASEQERGYAGDIEFTDIDPSYKKISFDFNGTNNGMFKYVTTVNGSQKIIEWQGTKKTYTFAIESGTTKINITQANNGNGSALSNIVFS